MNLTNKQRDKLQNVFSDFLEELNAEDLLEAYAGVSFVIEELIEDEVITEDELEKLDHEDLLELYYGRGQLAWDFSKDIIKDSKDPFEEVYEIMHSIDKSLTRTKLKKQIDLK